MGWGRVGYYCAATSSGLTFYAGQTCPGPNGNCNGQGTCNSQTGTCTCATGWTGSDCSQPAPAAQWAGTYVVQSGCSTASCCCVTTGSSITVVQNGLLLTANNLPVTGQCGGMQSVSLQATLASLSSTSATTNFGGQPIQLSLVGNAITFYNPAAPQCSASAFGSTPASTCSTPLHMARARARSLSVGRVKLTWVSRCLVVLCHR